MELDVDAEAELQKNWRFKREIKIKTRAILQ